MVKIYKYPWAIKTLGFHKTEKAIQWVGKVISVTNSVLALYDKLHLVSATSAAHSNVWYKKDVSVVLHQISKYLYHTRKEVFWFKNLQSKSNGLEIMDDYVYESDF